MEVVCWRLHRSKADRLVAYMNGLVWRYGHPAHYELEKAASKVLVAAAVVAPGHARVVYSIAV